MYIKTGFLHIPGLFLLLILTIHCSAQSTNPVSIKGRVTDHNGEGLNGVSLRLSTVTSDRISDTNGYFFFENLRPGTYILQASHVGYILYKEEIRLDQNQQLNMTVVLHASSTTLDDVTVIGKTETQQVREQAIRAEVIDTRAVSTQPATLSEVMNRAPGVRIRQSGGLGNQVDVSINGFQGRAVRYFRDGIPLDYLGDGYNIATLPLNVLERIEIYKGVLPVSLGADALGGAVNIVSRKSQGTTLDVSYELASFNTHRATLSGTYMNNAETWYVGGDVFFNHSDNDYLATVDIPDENRNPVPTDVRLFHNAFRNYYAEAFFGLQNQGWADELKISLATFSINRQQQHPTMMTNPYGNIQGKQHSFIPTVRYRKSLLDNKLDIDQFLVYNTVTRSRIDTTGGIYNWFGEFTPVAGRASESPQPANSDVDFNNFTSRTNIKYRVTALHHIELNAVHSHVERIGSDPLGARFLDTDIDVLSVPATYQKQVVGLGWESKWWGERLTNTVIGKWYRFRSEGTDTWQARGSSLTDILEKSHSSWGVAEALKYQLDAKSFVRASMEWANRLPEQEELFGDGEWRVSNFSLVPERSFNVNVGYHLQTNAGMQFETNAFYRKTRGIIMLIPAQPPYAQYQNFDNVEGYGLEADVSYPFLSIFTANANFTWQSVRMADIEQGIDQWKNGTRLRNTPFFFANAGLTASINHVFTSTDRLRPYVYYNFIREFYLENIPRQAEPNGFLGLFGTANINALQLIPNQQLWTAGFDYQPVGKRYTVGFEVKNIGNADLYDYYRVQRAGRSFHLKLNFQLNKNS